MPVWMLCTRLPSRVCPEVQRYLPLCSQVLAPSMQDVEYISHNHVSQLILLDALDPYQLCLEDQRTPCWNRSHSSLAVSELRWNCELSLLAYTHI